MQLGICGGPEIAPVAAAAGYDYIEINVASHLIGEAPEADFAPILQQLRACGLPCLAANVFVPGHLKITGPEVDFARLQRYVETVMVRAAQVGLQAIVFGSGGARKIPDGFARERAYDQLIAFGRMVAPLAERHGVKIAVEPLNRSETNVLNSVAEGLQYVKDVDQPAFRLLVDGYHWARENEPLADIVAAGPWLEHAHIATYTQRLAPGAEACDFAPFLRALAEAGYDKRLSIEGAWADMPTQAATAREILLDKKSG
ncbi:MAG: sugar phosphate isomerase/epimerase family protein [Chloroflexota bacterium]